MNERSRINNNIYTHTQIHAHAQKRIANECNFFGPGTKRRSDVEQARACVFFSSSLKPTLNSTFMNILLINKAKQHFFFCICNFISCIKWATFVFPRFFFCYSFCFSFMFHSCRHHKFVGFLISLLCFVCCCILFRSLHASTKANNCLPRTNVSDFSANTKLLYIYTMNLLNRPEAHSG